MNFDSCQKFSKTAPSKRISTHARPKVNKTCNLTFPKRKTHPGDDILVYLVSSSRFPEGVKMSYLEPDALDQKEFLATSRRVAGVVCLEHVYFSIRND